MSAPTDEAVRGWFEARKNMWVDVPEDAYYVYRGKKERAACAGRKMKVVGLHCSEPDPVQIRFSEEDSTLFTYYCIWDEMFSPKKNSRFPHECPRCRAPAYVGLLQVDCSRKCS